MLTSDRALEVGADWAIHRSSRLVRHKVVPVGCDSNQVENGGRAAKDVGRGPHVAQLRSE